MATVPENWKHYFANVNDKLASIALNLALAEHAPIPSKPYLLWVWIYFQTPRPDGLSDGKEFETLSAIEDALVNSLAIRHEAVEAGRITTDGHREFYLYGATDKGFKAAISDVMNHFKMYRFDLGSQNEPDWNQYFTVLYPSDEDLEKIKNMDVLEVLRSRGDTLTAVRDVHHWIYFRNRRDRDWFSAQIRDLEYKIETESEKAGETHPFGIHITRDQSVTPDLIDDAVLELFRLARHVGGDYDGWEAQVVSTIQ